MATVVYRLILQWQYADAQMKTEVS